MAIRNQAASVAACLTILAALTASAAADARKDRINQLIESMRSSFPAQEGGLGYCVEWGDKAFLLAPETTFEQYQLFVEALPPLENNRYQWSGSRWTTTSTDGSVALRQPMTLTWSYVPDGTTIPNGGSGDLFSGPSELYAVLDAEYATRGGRAQWHLNFTNAFNQWGNLTGITYAYAGDPDTGDDGASWPGTPGVVGVRGDIRIAMRNIDNGSNVLAYNFFPTTGDMLLDSSERSLWRSTTSSFRSIRNIVTHEHGHGLGYNHVDPINNSKLMEAFFSTAFDGPQQDDIRAGQFVYGDNFESNATTATASDIGVIAVAPAVTTVTNLAIETNGLVDNYRLPLPAFSSLNVTVTPVGTTYSQGQQGGSTSTVNALTIHNLRFRIIAPDGTTVITTVDNSAAGVAESVSGLDLSAFGAGTYFLQVDENSSSNDIQRYQFTVSYTAAPPTSASDAWLDLE
ncbi:MAG: matrixin family metalloprotease [Candidatus Sumerlaeia bacterium]|nr:matrixin family metalloprotease [Candidatus Sumerlaeia bacterium]